MPENTLLRNRLTRRALFGLGMAAVGAGLVTVGISGQASGTGAHVYVSPGSDPTRNDGPCACPVCNPVTVRTAMA